MIITPIINIMIISSIMFVIIITTIINHSNNNSTDTGVCKINTRSKTIRHESQPPFPQSFNVDEIKVRVDRRAK